MSTTANWGNAPEDVNVSKHFPMRNRYPSVLARKKNLKTAIINCCTSTKCNRIHTRKVQNTVIEPQNSEAENKDNLTQKKLKYKKVGELKPNIEKYLEPYKPEERLIFARFEGDEPLPQAENIKQAKTEAVIKVDNFFKAMKTQYDRVQTSRGKES